ncbi:beta strand repeat-containing protein [Urbifossiella limnaea]|uniref:Uncharacterized protein n=1 Tax=Urbifossiella limnaea TaxID=2528023 RepID=A0A517XPI8_9BACT|nr:Ig-like domain-containing protein [Urbifossiella limnaea]QDU19417.1 hypothetical protein ETAA1_13410 [Urbifossiella limnaea]
MSGTTWSVTLPAALAEGTYTVTATATDTVGNVKSATSSLVIDTTTPTPTLTSAAPDPTSTSPIPFTVTFDEDVTGFSTAGLSVPNAVITGFTQVDARTYTFGVAPQAQGTVSVLAFPAAATDAAGNASTASATVTRTFDSAGPVVTATPLTTNNPTPTLAGTVDDPAATVTVVVNGQTYTATVTANSWSADVTTALGEGTYDIVVTATDALGNSGTTTAAGGLVVDLTGPTAMATAPTGPTNANPISFTVDFGEAVTGFDETGLTVTGGTVTGVTPGAGNSYTVSVTADADGPVGVTVNAGAAQDAAWNDNTPSTTATVEYDGTAPTATLSTAAADPTSASPLAFTVTFSEVVSGFGVGGLDVTNGTASGIATTDGLTYTFDVTPAGDGPVIVTVTAGAAADAAGNASVVSNSVSVVFDGTAPVAAADPLTTTSRTPTLTSTVDDPDATVSVVVDGQTIPATVSGTSWSAVVPTDIADGTYDVVVTATDVLGNGATTTLTGGLVVDATAPTVMISAPSVPLTAGGPVTFTVTYADATAPTVTLTDADVSLDITGTAGGAVSVAGSGLVWTVTVTGVTGDGTIGIVIAAGTVTDAAGNAAPAAGPSAAFTADNTAPAAPTITGLDPATDTGALDTDGVTSNPKPTFTGTAEPGSTVEVVADDGTGPVSLGTVAADATTGAWSLTGPDALADGAYTVTAVATDEVGNASDPSALFVLVVDGSAPTATVDGAGTGGVSGTATDAGGSGVARVLVSLRESAGGGLYFDEVTGAFTSNDPLFFDATDDSAGGDFSAWSYALPPGTSGDYAVTARVIDLAGNQADSVVTPVSVT